MKRKITKVEFEALNEVLKAEYEEKNGAYFAKLEDDDEAITSLKQAKDNEKLSHAETKAKLKKFEDELANKEAERLRASGDVKALEDSWNAKYTTRESELLKRISDSDNMIKSTQKETILATLASKLVDAKDSRIFKMSVKDRIDVEIVDGSIKHRILDKEGKPSALSIEDFEKELRADQEYSSIVIASQASGTGGSTTNQTSRRATTTETPSKPLSQLSSKELAAHIKTTLGE